MSDLNEMIKLANPYAKNPKYKRILLVLAGFSAVVTAAIVFANTQSSGAKEASKNDGKEKAISTKNAAPPKIDNEPKNNAIIDAASTTVSNASDKSILNTSGLSNTSNSTYRSNPDIDAVDKAPKYSEAQLARMEAIKSSSAIQVNSRESIGNSQNIQPEMNIPSNDPSTDILSKLVAMQGGENGMPSINSAELDPNMQNRKAKFADTKKSTYYLDSQIEEARSKLELKAGSFIPAMMIHSINSDLPGEISAIVTQNVYDSTTGQYLLIPQGTKLNGIYDSQVAFGQKRLMTVWNRLIFPNGKTFNLGMMSGAEQGGSNGFKDNVHNNYQTAFGGAVLVALIGSGMQLSQPRGKTTAGNDAQETITGNIAQQTGTTAQGILSKMLNVQPTLEVESGYRFNIKVNKDMVVDY
jgi:type IV secretory pathway VirB10-like protein